MKLWVINRNTGELRHHGIKGMKWGQRLYQNKDGSLTKLGKLRYGTKTEYRAALKKQAAKKAAKDKARQENRAAKNEVKQWNKIRKKPLNELTDDQLELRKKRLKKENELKELENRKSELSSKLMPLGKKIVSKAASEVVGPALINSGREVLERWLKKQGYELAGLKDTQYGVTQLMKDQMESELKNKKAKADKETEIIGDWFKKREEDAKKKQAQDRVDKEVEDTIKKAEKKAEKQAKKNKKDAKTSTTADDDSKVHTGKVSGKGASKGSQKRKNKTKKQSKPDDYYDPIETDFVDRDTPASSVSTDLVRYGRRVISGYLT